MKIIFFGNADFGIPTLNSLNDQHDILSVVTNIEKPAGRGKHLTPTPIKKWAIKNNLPCIEQELLTDSNFIKNLKSYNPDFFIVIAYRLLPPEVFNLPNFSTINLHASILPMYRGAAPIQRAIMEGDEETGISYMLMEEGLDSGPVLKTMKTEIRTNDDYGLVHDRLSNMASESILQVLEEYTTGKIKPKEQSGNGAIYANKIQKSEAKINWNLDAESIKFLINAMSPVPGAWTLTKDGKRLKILKATVEETEGNEGIVLDKLVIGCGKKSLRIIEIQPAGKKVMPIEEFLKGYEVKVGSKMFN